MGHRDDDNLPTELMPPLDRFILGDELGAGGMGRVLRAVDSETGEVVAVKLVINADGDVEGERNEVALRFAREVRAASTLIHPNICRVVAWGRAPKTLYMAMELIDGPSVQQLHKAATRSLRKRLPLSLSVEIARQLCLALDHAHAHGVIHRDIKPANLMTTTAGVIKLVDFGIARSLHDEAITQTGALVGTPSYMSPEQVLGGTVDGRADQFAVGATLLTLVTGKMRFAGVEATGVLMKVACEPTPTLFEVAPEASPGLARTLARVTRLTADHRFATCADMARALEDSEEWRVFDSEAHARATVAAYLNDQDGVAAELELCLSDRHRARASRLADTGSVEAALLARRCASLLVAGDTLVAEPADTPAIVEALAAFAATPTSPGVLKRLADLYRANAHPRLAAAFLLRYLQERPQDSHASLQLDTIVDGAGPKSGPGVSKLSTRDIMAGVRTGGQMQPARNGDAQGRSGGQSSPPRPGSATAPGAVAARSSSSSSSDALAPRFAPLIMSDTSSEASPRVPPLVWALGAIMVAALAVLAFSRFVTSTVDTVQLAVSDNEAGLGRFETNNAVRRWHNALSEARGQSERGNHAGVVTAINVLLAQQPPAELAVEGMLLRASAREHLKDDVSARLDFEAFLRESAVNDPRRDAARDRLNAIYARLTPAPPHNPVAPMPAAPVVETATMVVPADAPPPLPPIEP